MAQEAQGSVFTADKVATWDRNLLFQQLNDAAADALHSRGLLPACSVLELGCGTGMLAEKIAASLEVYVGVDNSPAMADAFQQKIATRSDGKLHCLLGELPGALACSSSALAASTNTSASQAVGSGGSEPAALPRQFDLAVSHMTFHHIQDVPDTLRMLRQLLKPGGRIAVSDVFKEPGSHRFNNPAHLSSVFHVGGFTQEEMEQLLTGAGFMEVTFDVLTPFQKPSYEDPAELLTFQLFMATAAAPGA